MDSLFAENTTPSLLSYGRISRHREGGGCIGTATVWYVSAYYRRAIQILHSWSSERPAQRCVRQSSFASVRQWEQPEILEEKCTKVHSSSLIRLSIPACRQMRGWCCRKVLKSELCGYCAASFVSQGNKGIIQTAYRIACLLPA